MSQVIYKELFLMRPELARVARVRAGPGVLSMGSRYFSGRAGQVSSAAEDVLGQFGGGLLLWCRSCSSECSHRVMKGPKPPFQLPKAPPRLKVKGWNGSGNGAFRLFRQLLFPTHPDLNGPIGPVDR